MDNNKSEFWEQSYMRYENNIIYPKEEVVKFFNRFVVKRAGYDQFKTIFPKGEKIVGLDLGCGIGRQTVLMHEFNIDGYGCDISTVAIDGAKKMAKSMGFDLENRFFVLNDANLPFPDNFFDIAISDSCLDSMYFEIAKNYVKELDRVVNKYLFISLVSGETIGENYCNDDEVNTTHEQGTIQSYYNKEKIAKLIEGSKWKIKWMNIVREEVLTGNFKNSRFHIIFEKD